MFETTVAEPVPATICTMPCPEVAFGRYNNESSTIRYTDVVMATKDPVLSTTRIVTCETPSDVVVVNEKNMREEQSNSV